ncbi:MAG: hypothetical protein IKM95_03410 [Bacteroidales bacterium]|nr:hypothetical protein [Bacteroidales bacterium]
MAKAHENLKQLLAESPGKAFALDLTRKVYEWADRIPDDTIRYRIFEELTVRYETGEKTRRGLAKQEHYRFDAVLFVQPGYRALNQNQCFTIGIELKNSKADLMGDHKMDKYLGWTDLFFIGVPEELTEEAIRKAEEVSEEVFGDKTMVGVFDVENGLIYKMPSRKQSVSMENRLKIQEQVIYNVLFDEMKSITVKLEEMSIETIPFNNLPTRSPSEAAETPSGSPKPSRAANTPSNGQSAATSPEKPTSVRPTLDEGFVAARNEKRAENRARREEMAKDLTERNRLLTERTREQLAGLSDRDQLVFWCVRDATVHGGINGIDIPGAISQSPAAVNRSMKKLKERGLVALDGAPKYGKFKVIGDALKSSRCITCRLNEECQGTALHCGSYQAI